MGGTIPLCPPPPPEINPMDGEIIKPMSAGVGGVHRQRKRTTQKELQIHHKGIKISWGVVGVGVIWKRRSMGVPKQSLTTRLAGQG